MSTDDEYHAQINSEILESEGPVESKINGKMIAQLLGYSFVWMLALSIFMWTIYALYAGVRSGVSPISFGHWLAQWLYFGTVGVTLVAASKWVEKTMKVGIGEQLGILIVYGFIAVAWFVLAGLPIRILLEE